MKNDDPQFMIEPTSRKRNVTAQQVKNSVVRKLPRILIPGFRFRIRKLPNITIRKILIGNKTIIVVSTTRF